MSYWGRRCRLVSWCVFDGQLSTSMLKLMAAQNLEGTVPRHYFNSQFIDQFYFTENLMSDQVAQFEEKHKIEEERAPVNLYAWGSAECDQYDFGQEDDEDITETKKPIKLNFFQINNIVISKIACGGLHTLFLTSIGQVYGCGCNDVFVLGAPIPDLADKVPRLIQLPHGVDMISAGDSHSAAAHSAGAKVYTWGVYRNTNGNMMTPVEKPTPIGEGIFNKPIQKLLSGYNHTMVLMDKRVFCWGDQDTKVLGRKSNTRNSIMCSLQPEAIGVKNVIDVFTGGYHSFVKLERKNKKGQEVAYFAWGLNNYGQLGIGHTNDSLLPTEITAFNGLDIINIAGGEHHSVALEKGGDVFAFGRNDDGQTGLGEALNEQLKQQALEAKQKKLADLKSKQTQNQTKKAKQQAENTIKDLELSDKVFGYEYTTTPQKVEVPVADHVLCAGHYTIVYNSVTQKFYSWGMGTNYVLGTREEESKFDPYLIPAPFFKNEKVLQISLGGQSVAMLTTPDPAGTLPVIDPKHLNISDFVPKMKAFKKPVQKSTQQSQSNSKQESHKIQREPLFSNTKKSADLEEPVRKLKID